jgi:hypothetical protein
LHRFGRWPSWLMASKRFCPRLQCRSKIVHAQHVRCKRPTRLSLSWHSMNIFCRGANKFWLEVRAPSSHDFLSSVTHLLPKRARRRILCS